MDGNHRDPEVEVFAELSFPDQDAEVLVGGREEANVCRQGLAGSEALIGALAQEAKQLYLGGGIDFPDLVEEQGSALSLFHPSGAAFVGPGEGPLLMPEQFGFEKCGGKRGAVDCDHRTAGAPAELVDGLGDEFLAGTALSRDQNGGRRRTDLLDLLEDLLHPRGVPDEALHAETAFEPLMQLFVFGLQSGSTEGSLDPQFQFVDLETALTDIVIRPLLHRRHRHFLGSVGRHQDTNWWFWTGFGLFDQGQAILACHAKVGQQDIDGLVLKDLPSPGGIRGDVDVELLLQRGPKAVPGGLLVVDDQKDRSHGATIAVRRCLGSIQSRMVRRRGIGFFFTPRHDRGVSVIEVEALTRTFRSYRKEPGLAGAFRGLFSRRFETVVAVQDVKFRVEEGEFVGFLGPNGAGKTTTLKMLSGLLHPTSGKATVLGHVPWRREDGYRRQFALLLGQKNQLWWDLPARDSLELNARIYGIPRERFVKVVDEMSSLLGVGDKLSTAVRELSLGERMKCELIASLLHEPKVLFLDEPTIGLDVVSQKVVREFLREHNRTRKTTILLTSHYMADIQELCSRVIIIDQGRVFFDGLLSEVLDRFANFKIVTVTLEGSVGLAGRDFDRYGEVLSRDDSSLKLKVSRDRVIATCKSLLDELPVRDFSVEEVPVEEVIRQLFQRGHAGAPRVDSGSV